MSLGGDNILGRGAERWKGVGVGMDDSPVWLLTYDVSLSLHEESGFEDRSNLMSFLSSTYHLKLARQKAQHSQNIKWVGIPFHSHMGPGTLGMSPQNIPRGCGETQGEQSQGGAEAHLHHDGSVE